MHGNAWEFYVGRRRGPPRGATASGVEMAHIEQVLHEKGEGGCLGGKHPLATSFVDPKQALNKLISYIGYLKWKSNNWRSGGDLMDLVKRCGEEEIKGEGVRCQKLVERGEIFVDFGFK